ncbi:Nucleoporin gle1 [Termitomyces sp. T112]|nr:Nucleoporin gle1 [Termitomyces sp. T112]
MRFRAPRSVSPSPVRLRKPRHSSTFGLQSDSDAYSSSDNGSESDYDSDSDESVVSSSSDSFCYASESEVPKPQPRATHDTRNLEEQREIEDTVAAIRLRTRHHDPYEDWERQTRLDAFHTARKDLNSDQKRFHDAQDRGRTAEMERRAARYAHQVQEIEMHFERLRLKAKQEEDQLMKDMKARQTKIWEGIEGVIKAEEEKLRAKLAEEARQREEEERKRDQKRKEEEEARKAKEEKEAAEKRAREEEAREAEEEIRRQKEQEEEAARLRRAQELEEVQQQEIRRIVGMTTAEADWKLYHDLLEATKRDTMKTVKADQGGKSLWSKGRREITPKIGQLTSDPGEINRISLDIYYILNPRNGNPLHPAIYKALLYSLSKAIILQAETEVTAEKNSARPLATVAFNLLETVKDFGEVFFSKLVQRAGGWPVPYLVASDNYSGPDQARKKAAERTRKLAMGFREDGDSEMETLDVYITRISGIMRIYFNILKFTPNQQPLHSAFQLPRFWTWLTRLLRNKQLLELPVTPNLIYTALDVMDIDGRKIWGRQYNKLLELIYEGVTVGYEPGKLIGGTSPEANSARSRVRMTVERVLSG